MIGAAEVFRQNNGDVTKRYYAELNGCGHMGEIAVALFRAQKRSTAAKTYKGAKYRHSAYDVKNWSLSELCRLLGKDSLGMDWGWRYDAKAVNFEWVLYVDLPTGQCSFHSPGRICSKDYNGRWKPARPSVEAIVDFCDLAGSVHRYSLVKDRFEQPWGGAFASNQALAV